MLCFDPTRGIDIGTKQQIYQLLRDLAAEGAAVLLYTSELKEIQLACDRAIVIFGGRVVAEIAAADADEPTLLRAAYDLQPDAPMPEEVAAEVVAAEAAEADAPDAAGPTPRRLTPQAPMRHRSAAVTAATGDRASAPDSTPSRLRPAQLVDDRPARVAHRLPRVHEAHPAELRRAGIQGLAISVLPIAFAAVAQAIVVISGGIDLSVGSIMALTSVIVGRPDEGSGRRVRRRSSSSACCCWGSLLGAINGGLVVVTRVPGHRRHARDVVRLGGLSRCSS